jgi:hypothetical protein
LFGTSAFVRLKVPNTPTVVRVLDRFKKKPIGKADFNQIVKEQVAASGALTEFAYRNSLASA